jgi:hypothetical protein
LNSDEREPCECICHDEWKDWEAEEYD